MKPGVTVLQGLTPDQLLETHTVSQAEVMAAQLSKEVDRKREELRVMVGERYRDLIQAADTIHTMRQCSSSVIQSVSTMQGSCEAVQQHKLQSAGRVSDTAAVANANGPYLAVAASIKLLTVLPEQIWSAVEGGQWSVAAELYLVSQHVYVALQADQGGGVTHDKVSRWFPVIARQWDVLQQLHSSLVTSCRATLLLDQLSVEAAADSLLALMLLSGLTVQEGVSLLTQQRSQCLASVVTMCRADSAQVGVLSVSSAIMATINIYQSVLPSLQSLVDTMAQDNYQPTVSRIPTSIIGPTTKYLPAPIIQFKPKMSSNTLTELKTVNAESMFKLWLDTSLQLTRQEMKAVFEFVDSVEGLRRVEQAVTDSIGQEKLVLCGDQSVWEMFFSGMVGDRMMDIVKGELEQMLATAAQEVENMMEEEDISLEFVWQDSSSDLGAVWGKAKAEKQGLKMKCWGWNGRLQEIWRQLDSKLQKLLDCIKSYPDIETKCRHVSAGFVDTLLQSISGGASRDGKHVARVRVLQSFFHLTPTVELLLADQCENVKQQWSEQQDSMLTQWLTSLVTKLTSALEQQLTPDQCLSCLPAWDNVSISEEGDSGATVTSTIAVPGSPSLPLTLGLLDLSTQVHGHHPTSLPHTALVTVNTMVMDTLLHTYTSLAAITLTQNFALQLLFDIQFIQTLLLSRDRKDKYQSRIYDIVSSLESNIDPFDLSVFSPHVQDRVKASCVRLVTSVACLVPGDRLSIIASYRTLPSDNHNLLAGSTSTCSRFQLLPLAPTTTRPKTLLTSATTNPVILDTNRDKSPRFDSKSVQQTAANFFGTMSSSWFGNNN